MYVAYNCSASFQFLSDSFFSMHTNNYRIVTLSIPLVHSHCVLRWAPKNPTTGSFFSRATQALFLCTVSPFIRAAGRNEAATPFKFRGRARQMNKKKEKYDTHRLEICKKIYTTGFTGQKFYTLKETA